MTKNVVLIIVLVLCGFLTHAQTNKEVLTQLSNEKAEEFKVEKQKALDYAEENNIPVFIQTDRGFMELMKIDEYGQAHYYITHNSNSAKTIATNKVHPGGGNGYSLDGSGMTVHEWDGGAVRATHQELSGRVTQGDGASTTHYHAQHVAGTLIGSGVVASAKGMAPAANLRAFDWNSDESEMATEAANGALVSNHSYGYGRGWSWTGSSWTWYGNSSISSQEDYLFGFYDSQAQDWDQIAFNAPNYLIVKSAGNDRGDGPTNGSYPQDGPYDCISHSGVSKNVLTVGAVEDIVSGYSQPSDVVMSSFSSWGPCDDSRIKPDIVTNGVSLYSADDDNDSDYQSLSGTSMASPSATGSLLLLQEHYQETKGIGTFMKAATLKALAIHTADEAGTHNGPDYQFGWGLMNTLKAAQKITEDQNLNVIDELTLDNGTSYQRTVTAKGNEPLLVTIVWADKPGTPVSASLDPTNIMLVNDLDMKITQASNTYYPWKLSASNPSGAATRNGENNVDNVEYITIDNPTADTEYSILVDHDGTLDGGSQDFSIIISGIKTSGPIVTPVADFSASSTVINAGQSVTFTDLSTNNPTSWNWTFTGATPTSSTAQNPSVSYSTPGTYAVTLEVSNSAGSDTETKTNYITVNTAPISYCASQGNNYSYEWISNVEIDNFTKNSVGSSYSDFTNEIISLTAGNNVPVTLTPGFSGQSYMEYWKIWIDYNKDGDFEDSGEEVYSSNSSSTVSGNFTVDASANGTTRMRISMKYNAAQTPCETFTYGEVEDYTVEFGALQAPIADFSASSTIINEGQSITFTDVSTNNPTSWSWSFIGGTPSSSTQQNPVITYSNAGTYEVTLTSSNASGSDTKTKSAYITVNAAPVSYCSSKGNTFSYEWIKSVQINTYTKNSDGTSYSDHTTETINLNTGANAISLTPGFSSTSYSEVWRIWVDWNKDGDFTDSGEEVFQPASSSSTVTGSFTPPIDFSGQTRMRISMKWNGTPTPCETFSYGEVEDYTVEVNRATFESVQDPIAQDLKLYPNPAHQYFIIAGIETENSNYHIVNANGQIVQSGILHNYEEQIDISKLNSGMYMVRIVSAQQTKTMSLIVR
jgi:PKD repeat protein